MAKLCKFYFRLLHPKAISGKANEHFLFLFLLASSLIFEMPISGGSPRQKTVVIIFRCLLQWCFF
jgi:hypothetical protein